MTQPPDPTPLSLRYLMNDAEFYIVFEGGGRFSYRKGLRGCQVLPGTFGLTAVNAARLQVSFLLGIVLGLRVYDDAGN